jgi:hypothetical protein
VNITLDNQPDGHLDKVKQLDLSDKALAGNKDTNEYFAALVPTAVEQLQSQNKKLSDKPSMLELFLAVQWRERKGSMGALRRVYEDPKETRPAEWVQVISVYVVF